MMDSNRSTPGWTATMVTRGILSMKDLRAAIKTDLGVVNFRSLHEDHFPDSTFTVKDVLDGVDHGKFTVALPNGTDVVVEATRYPSGRIGTAIKRAGGNSVAGGQS